MAHHRYRTAILLVLGCFCCPDVVSRQATADPAPKAIQSCADRLPADVQLLYAAIKPQPEEMKWLQIPWLVDLDAGIKQARQEQRPVLIWVSGDEPLQRC